MKILLVEDEGFKQEMVEAELRKKIGDPVFCYARSVQQAVSKIETTEYDLVILDMALPSHDLRAGGSQPMSQPSGGIEVLLELAFAKRRDKVIILTQYPEIVFEGQSYPIEEFGPVLSERLTVNIADVVHFNNADDLWRAELRDKLP